MNTRCHKDTAAEEHALWQAFRADPGGPVREQLVRFYMSFLHQVVGHLYALRTQQELEYEDYLQYGIVGLLEAIDHYDESRGAGFQTYARYRIRGVVLNALPHLTERGEQIAFRQAVRGQRISSLFREVDPRSEDGFRDLVELTVGLAIGFLLEDSGLYEHPTGRSLDRYGTPELMEIREELLQLLAVLSERERQVVEYHYMEDLQFNTIAGILGVTSGRVSQLHAAAMNKLRQAYEELGRLDLRT